VILAQQPPWASMKGRRWPPAPLTPKSPASDLRGHSGDTSRPLACWPRADKAETAAGPSFEEVGQAWPKACALAMQGAPLAGAWAVRGT